MKTILLLATIAIIALAAVFVLRRAEPDSPAAPTQASADTVCSVRNAGGPLPRELYETSGLAFGTVNRLWTHNDGDIPALYAFDGTGRVVQQVNVEGVELDDWEDLESSACATGMCLYMSDTGDNEGMRRDIAIHIVPEPARDVRTVRAASTVRARYPEGAQDAEALFALPGGQLFIVTKGRQRDIALYRVPQQQSGDVVLERVRSLAPQPDDSLDRVTGATATPDGKWVAIRTNRTMQLYPAEQLVSNQPVEPRRVDLTVLRHRQGESIAIDNAGTAWFTSEDESGNAPMWASMTCRLQ